MSTDNKDGYNADKVGFAICLYFVLVFTALIVFAGVGEDKAEAHEPHQLCNIKSTECVIRDQESLVIHKAGCKSGNPYAPLLFFKEMFKKHDGMRTVGKVCGKAY